MPNAQLTIAGSDFTYGVASDETYVYGATRNGPFELVRVPRNGFASSDTFTYGGSGGANECVTDKDQTYIYVGLDTDPGKIVRVLKSDFSTNGTLTLGTGYGQVWGMVIVDGFLYCLLNRAPAVVAKITLSDFSTVVYKEFTSGDQYGRRMVTDGIHLYCALTQGGTGKVGKLALSDFSTYSSISTGFNGCECVAVNEKYIFAANTASPANTIRILKSDFATTSALNLATGNNQCFGAHAIGKKVYYGTFTNPLQVAIVDAEANTQDSTLTLPAGYNNCRCMRGDPDKRHIYVGQDTSACGLLRFVPNYYLIDPIGAGIIPFKR